MDIKLIAMDLDGTLLKSDGSISDRVLRAVANAAAKGYTVVPATGRTLSEVPEKILSLDGIRYIILANGASIMDLQDDRESYADLIPLEKAAGIFDMMYGSGIAFVAYSEGVAFCDERYTKDLLDYYSPRGKYYANIIENMRFVENLPAYFRKAGRAVEKIYIPLIVGEARKKVADAVSENPDLVATSSEVENMEINASTANKGMALAQLCVGLGIAREQVMTIGDGNNDKEMLAFAGFSVAMGNSSADVKSVASYVTVPNDEDGAAVALRKFLEVE